MIFITVGTSPYVFKRFFKHIDEALLKNKKKLTVIAQMGPTKYNFRYKKIRVFEEIPYDIYISLLTSANIVIGHGGAATVFQCLSHCKHKPFIIPRNFKRAEHIDNHQIYFTRFMEKRGLIKTKNLSYYLSHPDKNPFSFARNKQLIHTLALYIDK